MCLAKLPVQIVFMFDGAEKPALKRGHKVISREHIMYQGMTALIDAFGFCYLVVSTIAFKF